MYGTITRIKIDPSRIEELKTLGDSMGTAPGQVARYVIQADDDPGELFLVAAFVSKDAYNAHSSEQQQRLMQLRSLLIAAPESHAGEIVSAA